MGGRLQPVDGSDLSRRIPMLREVKRWLPASKRAGMPSTCSASIVMSWWRNVGHRHSDPGFLAWGASPRSGSCLERRYVDLVSNKLLTQFEVGGLTGASLSLWTDDSPEKSALFARLVISWVHPTWAHTCGSQSRCELVTSSTVNGHCATAAYSTASRPLRSSRLSSFRDGPLGCFSPISHLRTVDGLVFSTEARTV